MFSQCSCVFVQDTELFIVFQVSFISDVLFFYKNNPKLLNSCHPLRVKRSKTNVEPLRSFDRKRLSSYCQLNSMYFHIYFQGTLTKPSERRQSP